MCNSGGTKKAIHVVAAVICRGHEIFATQRGYGDYKDWWEFPGGKMEQGETPEEALIREIKEELDAAIVIDDFLCTVEYEYPAFHLEMDCFICHLDEDEPRLLEHEAARWLAPEEFGQVRWLGADIEVLEKLKERFGEGARRDNSKEAQSMKFKMIHENYNVADLDVSLAFYEKALGLREKRRSVAENGEHIIVYVGNEESEFELELTWLRDHPQKYDIGEEEFHLAFRTDDYEAAHKLHEEMGCICFENHAMGLYFIQDPDGYWLEILPVRK